MKKKKIGVFDSGGREKGGGGGGGELSRVPGPTLFRTSSHLGPVKFTYLYSWKKNSKRKVKQRFSPLGKILVDVMKGTRLFTPDLIYDLPAMHSIYIYILIHIKG